MSSHKDSDTLIVSQLRAVQVAGSSHMSKEIVRWLVEAS